jgi:hypothetical protein
MSQQWQVSEPRTIEVEAGEVPVREVHVRLGIGRVDVVASTEPGATVEVTSVRGRPVDVRWSDGVLRVVQPQLSWDGLLDVIKAGFNREDAAEVSIAVPHNTRVMLGTVLADGLLAGTTAPASVRTVSGALVLDGVCADVVARTVSGSLDVRDQDGSITVDTVSGSVTVHAVRLPSLKAKSVTGPLAVDLRAPRGHLAASTVSGEVTVRVPAGAGYVMDAKSVSGKVVADGRRLGGFANGTTTGRLADGDEAVSVQVATVSGDVTLLRAGSPAEPQPAGAAEGGRS